MGTVTTNAMRILKTAGIPYNVLEYEVDEQDLSGVHAAGLLNLDAEQVFKTLVVNGVNSGPAVFCIPVAEELDLKKCASILKEKKIEMLALKDLLSVTGYIRGGCSPVGMKKKYPTYIHETAILYDDIFVSAGIRGCQLEINPEALAGFIEAEFVDVIKT